jgi:hypothetical protein
MLNTDISQLPDYFECKSFNCTLSKKACASRHTGKKGDFRSGLQDTLEQCRICEIGKLHALQLGLPERKKKRRPA